MTIDNILSLASRSRPRSAFANMTRNITRHYSPENRRDNAACAHTVRLMTVNDGCCVGCCAGNAGERRCCGIGREEGTQEVRSRGADPGCPGIRVNYSPIAAHRTERRGIKLQDTYNAFNGPGPLTISRKPGPCEGRTSAPRHSP